MKFIKIPFLFLLLSPIIICAYEARTWTTKDDQTFVATLKSYDIHARTLRLKREADQRTINLDFSDLSTKDIEYLKSFKYPSSCRLKVREVYNKSISDNKFLDIEILNLSKSAQAYLVFVYYFAKDEETQYTMIDGFIIGGELGSMKRYKNQITSKLFEETESAEENSEEGAKSKTIDGFIVVALDSEGAEKDAYYSRPTLKNFFHPEMKNHQKELMKMVKKDTKNKFLNFKEL